MRKLYAHVVETLELPPEVHTPDYELDVSDVSPEVGNVVLGVKAGEGAMRPYWETFDDFHVEIEEVIHTDEEHVVDLVRDGGRVKGSDAEVSNRFFHVWTFREGKIARLSIHTDRKRALEAAGLSE